MGNVSPEKREEPNSLFRFLQAQDAQIGTA
jgi:hypothetical protein